LGAGGDLCRRQFFRFICLEFGFGFTLRFEIKQNSEKAHDEKGVVVATSHFLIERA
jgi:hypothetical protein